MSNLYDVDYNQNEETVDASNVEVVDEENFEEEIVINFKRVNFDDPESIMHYGADILAQMKTIMLNTANLTIDNETSESQDRFSKLIKEINAFSEKVEEEKNLKALVVNSKPVKKTIKFWKKKVLNDNDFGTFVGEYKRYVDSTNEITSLINEKKEETRNNNIIINNFINSIKPYYDALQAAIRIGEEDLIQYKEKMNVKFNKTNPTIEEKIEQDYYIQICNEFVKTLTGLKESSSKINITVIEARQDQLSNLGLVRAYEKIIDTDIPTLQFQANIATRIKKTRQDIDDIQKFAEAANNTYKKSAETLLSNVEDITKLNGEGIITTETLGAIADNVKKTQQVLVTAEAETMKAIAQRSKFYDSVNKSLNQVGSSLIRMGQAETYYAQLGEAQVDEAYAIPEQTTGKVRVRTKGVNDNV